MLTSKGVFELRCLINMIILLPADNYQGKTSNHKLEYITVEDIFKECFDRYFEKLYGYAFSIVRDNAEAKDIVQSAYVKLWEKRREVNITSSGQSYLYTSVYRLSLNTIRNRKIRDAHHGEIIPIQAREGLNATEEKEKRARIDGAIDKLPPRCKEVFCKSRIEGKKYAAIATELGISIKTVEAQMGKALKMLREQLADLLMIFIIYFLLH